MSTRLGFLALLGAVVSVGAAATTPPKITMDPILVVGATVDPEPADEAVIELEAIVVVGTPAMAALQQPLVVPPDEAQWRD